MIPNLLLASNSPRRRELLALTGWTFNIRPVNIDESPRSGEDPWDYVLRLAETKARAAARFARSGQLVLAADTTVADGKQILGKPVDAQDAETMLRGLRGKEHSVYTAISVSDPDTGRLVTDLCATRVWMRNYSDAEMQDYIASGDPFDKAGGYAIQHKAFHPVERIAGCYACVVGLPICHVVRAVSQFGSPLNASLARQVASACSAHLEIDTPCPDIERLLLQDWQEQEPAGDQD